MPTTRREFLKRSALTALGVGLGGPRTARASVGGGSAAVPVGVRDPVIVAVVLDGGNDALNTIVPLREYDLYRRMRPSVGVHYERLIPLPRYETEFGVNPAFAPMVDLFADDKLAIVNGVGPPQHTVGLFNHEASQRVFFTADTTGGAAGTPSGWLGRAVGLLQGGELPIAVGFGGNGALLSGGGARPLVLPSLESFRIQPSGDSAARGASYRRIQEIAGNLPPAAEDNRQLRLEVLEFSGIMQELADAHRAASPILYPDTHLGQALSDCAAVILARDGVRALAVNTGSFDTHANQNRKHELSDPFGYHETLLAEVAEALAAFSADLDAIGAADDVLTVVFSEFGRRVPENPSLGTDHGFGSTMFVVGKSVRGGVYGDYPSLADLVLGGNLDAPVDFRSVYATLLARHFDLDPEPILGGAFPLIGFLR